MDIKISRVHPDARLPKYKTDGAACFDIEALGNVVIKPNEIKDIRTGLIFVLPAKHVLILQPRSSSPRNGYTMPHSVGILDSDYCGSDDELFVRIKNVTNKPIKIEKQQRIAQAYIIPLPKIKWKEVSVDSLSEKSRGGFGSTGK